ncbi:putative Zn(2)-C6 fungal-type domain-containing protein [Seiridium unicorne]|uniref:Zn(2)-C6 fungal-type domain-containing protein n=1 Tax=Seiridium unicorne TaxID=138068 RepID=A0ABR2UJZ0_9PEZI
MKSSYLPFVAFGEDDVSSESPRIFLDMKASRTIPELSVTLPYYIDFTIRRPAEGDDQSLIFRWGAYSDAFAQAQLVLLHITEHGRERVEIEPLEFAKPDADAIQVNGWNQFLWELPSGGEIKMRDKLTANYQRRLEPGEKYELLWPGAEVSMWDWGSIKDHVGKQLESQKIRQFKLPKLILPTSTVVAFTAKQESELWPGRPEAETEADFQRVNMKEDAWRREQDRQRNPPPSPSPISPSERVAGAPSLSMEIECSSEWNPDDIIDLTIRVTYAGVAGEGDARPITFHTQPFVNGNGKREGIGLYRRRDGGWERSIPDDGFGTGFGIFDDPPVPVNVCEDGQYNDQFASLQPGESWTTQRRVQNGTSWTSLPSDVKAGETFKYVVKGAVVDWWDWGTKADHRDTVVKLPCWIAGDVVEPADNNGRPKLMVPVSNETEFCHCAYNSPQRLTPPPPPPPLSLINDSSGRRDDFSNVLERLNGVDQTLALLTQLTQQIAAKPHPLDSRQQVPPGSPVSNPTRPLSPNDDHPFLLDAFAGLPAGSQSVKDPNSEPIHETMELQFGGERIFGWPAAITLITSLSRKLAAYVSPGNGGHDTEEGGSIAPLDEQSSTVQVALRLHLENFPFTGLCHESSFVIGDSKPIISPPRLLVDYFVDSFLRNINNVIPIFDKFTLRSAIDEHYSGETPGENDPWALILNNIAALGLSLEVQTARTSQASSRSMNEDIMPLFLRNCDRALANLEPFMRPSQDNVQALITLALVARHLYSNIMFEKVCQAACQVGRIMGLHRSETRQTTLGGSAADRERLFKVLYAMDKQRVFVTGHPCDLYSFDADILFGLCPADESPLGQEQQAFNNMMRIWEDMYLVLYSSRAASAGPAYCARQVQVVSRLVEKWSQRHCELLDPVLLEQDPALAPVQLELKYCYHITQVLILRCDRGNESSRQLLLKHARHCLNLIAKVGPAPINTEHLASLARILGSYPMVAFIDLLSYHLPTLLEEESGSDLPPEIYSDIELLKVVPTCLLALQHADRAYSFFGRLYVGLSWAIGILDILQVELPRRPTQPGSMKTDLDMLMAQPLEKDAAQMEIELGNFGFVKPITTSLEPSKSKLLPTETISADAFLSGPWNETTSTSSLAFSEALNSDFFFRDMFARRTRPRPPRRISSKMHLKLRMSCSLRGRACMN